METNDMRGQRNDQWMQALREESAQTTENQDAQMKSRMLQAEGMRQIRDQERYDALDLKRRKRDAIESAIAMTPKETGRLSPRMLQYLNAERGIETNDNDIQDGQIVEGGWLGKSGDYGFVVARKGADGTVTPERHRLSRADIYGMASNRPDLYDAATVEEMGKELGLSNGAYVSKDRLLGLTAKHKASRDKLDEELNAARMNLGGRAKFGVSTGDGVEIAKINAASREKVAGMTTGSRERIAEGNNQTRKEIAGAQISSREKIAEAANALKELGIDVSAALKERGYDLQEARDAETARHNKAGEGIAGSRQREQERHNKEQERLRGKSVEERERHNRAGEATAERRADTQERRVEDQYELGDRKQTHNENRLEQDKAKSGRAADQRDAELAERKRQFDEREKRLSKPKDQGGTGEDSRKAVSAMKGMLELARTTGMSDEDLADLESWTNERIKGMAGIGGETSGDGGAKGKVKYTDLKPGQKFTMTDKDGKKRRCVKTEKGYKFID